MSKTIYIGALLIVMILSCRNRKENCDVTTFKELKLYSIQYSLKLPDYRIIDSVRYEKETILNYSIKSLDSVLDMNCIITSHDNDSDPLPDINLVKTFEKQEVEFNGRDVKLLTDTITNIGANKVGYIKYLVLTPSEKFYEARIFFYRDRKLITIWLFEKYQDETQNEFSLVDCILSTIKLY